MLITLLLPLKNSSFMKRLLLLGLIAICFFPSLAFSQDEAPSQAGSGSQRPFTFIELWNNSAYYETNIERKGFSSILTRYEGKLGIHPFNNPLQVYWAYYGVSSQDKSYWNNALFSGAGVRFKPFESYAGSNWQNEWIRDIKIFAENLTSDYFQNKASAEAAGLKNTDTRYGLEVYHEWNLDNPIESVPWGELWSKLDYRSTNFSASAFDTYILYFQPKIGKHLGRGIETYLRADLTSSPKSDYWLNVLDYGVGVRFEPFRKKGNEKDIFKKFKMFIELLGVSYLKDQPGEANKQVASDLRFGMDFSYGR